MYALYEQITKGFARRIGVYATKQEAIEWMEIIAFNHSRMFIEKVG